MDGSIATTALKLPAQKKKNIWKGHKNKDKGNIKNNGTNTSLSFKQKPI